MSRAMNAHNERKQVVEVNHQSARSRLLRGATVAAVLCLIVFLALGSLGHSVTRARAASGHAARAIALDESGNLHLTSRHGFTLNEQGRGSGTIAGTIYVHLKIVSTSRVTAEVNIYPQSGSISGYGTAGYHREGAKGSFSGSLSINRGTGSYDHAQGSNLSFSGTIQRSNYAVTVHVRGMVAD
jgi:hypothetical protein